MRKMLFAYVAAATLSASTLNATMTHATMTHAASATVDRSQVRSFLARLAISPEAACAAGLTAQDVEPLFQAASDQLDTLLASINATDAAVDAARASLAQLVSDPENGMGGGSSTAVEQAQIVLQNAIATRTNLASTAFAAVTASLSTEVQTVLSAIRTNQRQPVSIEFKVILRSQSEWTALNRASGKVNVNGSCARAASASDAGTVANAAADPAVSLARSRLEQSLTSVKTAWTASTDPQ